MSSNDTPKPITELPSVGLLGTAKALAATAEQAGFMDADQAKLWPLEVAQKTEAFAQLDIANLVAALRLLGVFDV